MREQLVNVLFKEDGQEGNKLQPGTMTLTDLYNTGNYTFVQNAAGDQRYIKRRDFHIYDPEPLYPVKRKAIVCDIDGVCNVIPKKVDGTDCRQLVLLNNGSTAQWTELNKTLRAQKVTAMFDLLRSYQELGFDIIFLTARGDTQRIVTDMFLRDGLGNPDYHLFMRGFSANDVSAPDCKAQMMQACIAPYFEVEYFIDDCAKNCAAVKEVCPDIKIMQISG